MNASFARLLLCTGVLALAACSASTMAPSASSSSQQAVSAVKPLVWEPPTVVASNASDHTAHFNVTSPCDPPPWSPTSGTIAAGSAILIVFSPNGNPCSYQTATIKATDGSGVTANECDVLVVGGNIFLINNSNTNCTLGNPAPDKWAVSYSLISGAPRHKQ